jgi:ribosomal-protein-alanine N-acetyltransferase
MHPGYNPLALLELNFSPFPVLRTRRLVLRALVPGDASALFVLRSDPRVMQHIGRPMANTVADAEALLEDMQRAFEDRSAIVWALTRHDDPELVGTIGFWRIAAEHHHGELGYILRPDLWGQGITREAATAVIEHGFAALHFHRIEACVDPANTASVALLETLGFAREAHLVQNFLFGGVFWDTLMYGRLNPARRYHAPG